ncbi:MAG TPA: hypothetical protein VFV43_07115, partial [Limnobacter sp.]|nr:hypothetical protein [Limnobacter sp.]
LTTAANAAQATDVQIVDRAWVHIGGIGYNQNYANKMEMIQILRNNPIALANSGEQNAHA